MCEPRIDSLHDPFEDQLSAARYKAERDAAMQELQAIREHDRALRIERHATHECLVCEEEKAERLGRLVWRLQNRLARAHRRERSLRKGMREWREKVISAPVRTVSAYDLLPEEDLQALRWVREQGGFEVVKTNAELFRRLKYERDKFRDLCRDYEKAIDKPQVTMSAYDLLNEGEREVLRMWPRYEDGEPVRFGDRVKHRRGTCAVDSVRLYIGGLVSVYGNDSDRQVVVTEPVFRDPVERADAQVPAADGEPLREGETVWNVKTGEMYVVGAFASDYVNVSDGRGGGLQLLPSQLTHERPESWERWIEDAGKSTCEYFGSFGTSCDGCQHDPCTCDNDRNGDLVRRAKALAEVSE